MHRGMPCDQPSGEDEKRGGCFGTSICIAQAAFECRNFMDSRFFVCNIACDISVKQMEAADGWKALSREDIDVRRTIG